MGVPRDKSNQISSLSNFARNMGGSAGTALLTTFLARSAQVNQTSLASNISTGGYGISAYISNFAQATHQAIATATPIAMAQAYGELQQQANMLAYKNAFLVLAVTVVSLSPLVWIMRLPPKNVKVDPEQMAAH